MAMTPSQRPTREWPLFVFSLAVVGAACFPLLQWSGAPAPDGPEWLTSLHRTVGRFLVPEQIACYACFTWGCLILFSRYLEVRRQRRGFRLGLLPTDEGMRILPEDGRPLQRRVDQLTEGRGPFILANMIRMALGKYAVSRSNQDVSETVRTQAEVDLGRLVASMSTVHYLAWALPALGFLGTVRGLAGSLGAADLTGETDFIAIVSSRLGVAFDCTLVALALSLVVMFLLHSVQRDEEALVIDCRQYCLEHLVNRLYNLEPVAVDA
ncbi:MAG TPA: MotA/TolQ/ExbB proton channel family protein [Gemmataceae bacterium]|jgi:biopolymer transport protein ExbB/TolQ|nr:MotA/TolQ/ExbB proton channel family protein [Gemmataceae bacterium]